MKRVVQRLLRLAGTVAWAGGGGPKDGPNVEYPWEGRDADGGATWVVPAEHRFDPLNKLRRPRDAARMLVLVRTLLDRFDRVVG